MTADGAGSGRDTSRCIVVGAGIVGVCCAVALQRAGLRVTLIDRGLPGMGCSFGNAGLIQTGACVPLATPEVLRRLPGLMFRPTGPLVIRWRQVLKMRAFLSRFIQATRHVDEISSGLAEMLRQAATSYETLLADLDLSRLIRTSGEMYVYESIAAFDSAKQLHETRRQRGIQVEFLSGHEARELEPALGNTVTHAVLLPDTRAIADPYLLSQQLAARFVGLGGRVEQALVRDIRVKSANEVEVVTTHGATSAGTVVLAAGAESAPFARRLGLSVPLQPERGYHLMVRGAENLKTPIVSGEFRFGVVRLLQGTRLVAGSELAALSDPPDFRRIQRLHSVARRLIPSLGDTIDRRWVGARPSMPDSLPVIMRSPASHRVLFAFGHGHLGLTLGAFTGRLTAELAVGDASPPGYLTWPRRYKVVAGDASVVERTHATVVRRAR